MKLLGTSRPSNTICKWVGARRGSFLSAKHPLGHGGEQALGPVGKLCGAHQALVDFLGTADFREVGQLGVLSLPTM